MNHQVELRLPLEGQPVALALFADVGVGAIASPSSAAGAPRAGAGAAAGCGVKYGPIRLDVAVNAKGERRVHVGMAADWED